MDDVLADFIAEIEESLARLESNLILLERTPDDAATLALILRLLHNIKGTSGFLPLKRLERVTHAAEDLLADMRDRLLRATPEIITTLLAALDTLKAIISGVAFTGREPPGDDTPLVAALAAATAQPPSAGSPATHHGKATDRVAPRRRLSPITTGLQHGQNLARIQPIGRAWQSLPRLVHALARDTGKKIALAMHGSDTQLDREVLELIRAPLTHMVRNACDHGLEPPVLRRAAGKPETGQLTLTARHADGQLIVELSDDGAGLNVACIRARILANGLATDTELAGMCEAEIHRFIFRPGFSTATEVTAISGRGVGLDVVNANIAAIAGSVTVASAPGIGTTVTLTIPLAEAPAGR